MATSASVEVVYRGIFQKRLANRISRGVVLGARKGRQSRHGLRALRRLARAQRHSGQELRRRRHRRSRARVVAGALRADKRRGLDRRRRHDVQGHRVVGLVRHPADQQAGRARAATLIVTSDQEPDDLLQAHQGQAVRLQAGRGAQPGPRGRVRARRLGQLRRAVGRQRRQHRLQLPGGGRARGARRS